MPVPQQATLFASAATVVAPHGAGLANLVFCAPGTRVVELITPAWVRATYWQLAACVKLQYSYLKCSLYEGRDAYPQDITVDCDLLQRALDLSDQ
jgi:capsular polysaccharide biosynthesis protein